ncbi:MAG: UDP-N-acetylmuramate dehydrogenase [Patescibacteria group bacterium]
MGTKTFRELTSFRVGGQIAHYKEVKNKGELVSVVNFAKKNNLPIFILGGGTDILVSDSDYTGVVIKCMGTSISYIGSTVTAEAGMVWDKLVEECVNKNLQGIECLSGIPGSVGATPVQNIGAYGQELKDVFVSLTAYDIEKEKFVVFNNEDCGFSYRESIFKKTDNWQKFIITSVTLKLSIYSDPDLSLQNIRDEILRVRGEKFENPKEVGNAGSFFKNPIVDTRKRHELEKKYPDIRAFGNKISAGWLIENVGWKGKSYKSAAVSPNHALVLINPNGKTTASDIFELSQKIINDVNDKFGIKLEREVQLINF